MMLHCDEKKHTIIVLAITLQKRDYNPIFSDYPFYQSAPCLSSQYQKRQHLVS